MAERLYRSRGDRVLAGVAAGVADALDADPSIVRIVWALLAIPTGGIAIVAYIVMAIVVPEAPPGYDTTESVRGATAGGEPGTAAETAPGAVPGTAGAVPGTASAAPAGPPPTSSWTASQSSARAARRARRRDPADRSQGGLIAGVVLIIIGGVFLIREVVPWFDWRLWWPIGLIALGVLLLVLALRPGRPSE